MSTGRWSLSFFAVALAVGISLPAFAQEEGNGSFRRKESRTKRGGEEEGSLGAPSEEGGRRSLPGPGGASSAIVVDGGNLYVVMGGTLYKVDKESLQVVEEKQLSQERAMGSKEGARGRGPRDEGDREDDAPMGRGRPQEGGERGGSGPEEEEEDW